MSKSTTEDKIVIYGDSDFAEQAFYQLESDGRYKIVAFTVDIERIKKRNYLGLPIYPFQKLGNFFQKKEIKIFVAIGYSKMNSIRESVTLEVIDNGYNLLTYISKNAVIGQNVKIGDGSFICEFVSIGPKTSLGIGVIILPHTRIAHDVIVADFCYLSSSLAIGGYSEIKRNSFIGLNSTIRNNIIIAERNILGSASNVVRSTEPYSVYVGNPAKRIKDIGLDNINI